MLNFTSLAEPKENLEFYCDACGGTHPYERLEPGIIELRCPATDSHFIEADPEDPALDEIPEVVAAIPSVVKKPPLSWRVRQWFKNLLDGSFFIPTFAKIARKLNLLVAYSELYGQVIHADGSVTNYGLLGRRVVTDAGVAYLTADMAGGASDINAFKFHGYGTGGTAESAAQTALVTELTTQYAVDSTRPTGSQASATNTYTTVGDLVPDSGGTIAVTEHGLFSASSAGTMWDRTLFSAVNVVAAADTLRTTYVATFPSNG